jgi:periplasmic protein CpxP/Spy
MLALVVLRGAALAAMLVPSICAAQSTSPAASSAAATQQGAPQPSAASQAAAAERIRTLQSQLGITEAQMPLWDAFAQAMRDNAAATDALFTQRAGAVATMTAPDNMHSYAQIARAYADNTERLATAFDGLYASLSDTQRQTADTLFRQQATAAAQPRARR